MVSDQKDIYAVILLKTQGNHIVIESEGFEAAYSKWAHYRDHWTQCLHEKKPFIITEKEMSVFTAFDPTFVYEIILKKQDTSIVKKTENNPYYKEMMDKGFTNTFTKNTGQRSTDLLDQGYTI